MGVIRLDLPVGLPEILPDSRIKIYPNPVEDITSILSDHYKLQRIVIANCMGQRVIEIDNIFHYQYDLNLSSANPGLYFVRLTDENSNSETVKLVVK